MDTLDESETLIAPEKSAISNVSFDWIIFLLIIPIIIFDQISKTRARSRDAKRTTSLMKAVLMSNTAFQMCVIVNGMTCADCTISTVVIRETRILLKSVNRLFLIHRAKLAQGMAPILSRKWFEKILPCIVIAWMCIMCFGAGRIAMNQTFMCSPYSDSGALNFCWDSTHSRSDRRVMGGILTLDVLWTIFLLALFIVPLHRVYRADLGVMNDNQLRQRLKLKRLLYWSVALTFLNQVTSTFYFLPSLHQSSATLVLGMIGKLDPPINVWTSWLMVTRNRLFLQRWVCCHRLRQAEGTLLRAQSVFSDIASRSSQNSHQPVQTQSKSSIKLPIPLVVPLPVEMDSTS